jgi:RNA polymerase sigma-70 factor (ECF subfamily)
MLAASIRPLAPPALEPIADELDPRTLELCRAGQRAALELFVRCYQRRVFAFLSRALGQRLSIDDLAQEVFLRAYRSLPNFDPSGQARLSTWLLTIAYRVLVDARRRERFTERCAVDDAEPSPLQNPEKQLWDREIAQALTQAAEELAPEQRDVFILAEFHELSLGEIARVTGTREATVKTRLFRARSHLRTRLASLWETNR